MSVYEVQTAKQGYLDQFYQTMLSLIATGGSAGAGDIPAPRLKLIALTRVKVDEAMGQAEGTQFSLTSLDNSNVIDLYINALLDESAKHLLQTAPIHIIHPTDGSDIAPVFTEGSDVGLVYLPDDYLRLVGFKLQGWLQEATTPITTRDKKYSLQHTVLKGGIAKPVIVLNSAVKTQNAVQQLEKIYFSGAGGTADVFIAGVPRKVTFVSNWTDTLSTFVNANFLDWQALGVTVSNTTNYLVLSAVTPGVPFPAPFMTPLTGEVLVNVVHTRANVPARETKRTLEYYSDPSKEHVLEKFSYIANVGADYVQPDLWDALTWISASKLLQIWGQFSGNQAYSDRAMAQVELSYKNLL